MTALSADTGRPQKLSAYDMIHELGVSATTQIYKGSLVVLNGGYMEPGTTALGLVAVGVAFENVDNTAGADGDEKCKVMQGIFRFANGSASITAADRGALCYIVDDNTVHLTDGTGTRSRAGIIYDVDAYGVFVLITFPAVAGA